MKLKKNLLMPLTFTGIVLVLDQVSKAIIHGLWPIAEGERYRFITQVFSNDFLQIIHVRNKAIAFSLGRNLPEVIQPVLFIVLPLLVLGVLLWYYFRTTDFTRLQRWAVAGILGGGIGNLIDRVFRPDGVIDFIDIKFYGLFGWERWPTFNVADASVVICCLLLLVSIIIVSVKGKKPKKKVQK